MNNKSDNARSVKSQLSSKIRRSVYKKKKRTKKPCEICGSSANEHLITTCLKCRDTREHIYCMKVMLHSVPPMWLCEACSSSSCIIVLDCESADSITMSDSSSCTTHQPSQAHTSINVVDEASSPMFVEESPAKKQKLPDLNMPYDCESSE